ncbi:hypothetical protein EVI01_23140 [Enterococcus villorum]|uniref:Uncharacterized protein n=1 Tax=Enterococcus villorum TaxID=112904 RepID=A0A511J4P6_9ENTE|nr:hypothetical protein EVI01_23140 [Enterococcus villorum]
MVRLDGKGELPNRVIQKIVVGYRLLYYDKRFNMNEHKNYMIVKLNNSIFE